LTVIAVLDISLEIRAVENFAGRASVVRHGAVRGDRLQSGKYLSSPDLFEILANRG